MSANPMRARAGGLSRLAQFAGLSKPRAADGDTPDTPEDDDAPATQEDVQDVQDDVDDVQEDVEDVQDDVDDLTDRVEQLEDEQEDEEDDPNEPPVDKPEARNAYRKGRALGAKQERKRITAIMGCEAAGKSRQLAVHYAFRTATPAKAAIAALSAAAADVRPSKAATPQARGSALDKRMGGTKQVTLGTGAAERGVPTTSAELADSAVALARSAGIVK